MIRNLCFERFKSFENSSMELTPFTLLIGSNASGKSNAIDGLRILSKSISGADLAFILDGFRGNVSTGIRGGSKGCPRFEADAFTLGAIIDLADQGVHLVYELSIAVEDRIFVEKELLKEVTPPGAGKASERVLFQTVAGRTSSGDISVEYDNRKRGPNPRFECLKFASVLSQVSSRLPSKSTAEKHVHEMANVVIEQLRNVLFLDPIPHEMRDYVPHTSVHLDPSASNLSAVIAQLIQKDNHNKKLILGYLREMPDQEILDLDIVKTSLGDVMLRVKEQAGKSSYWVDARGLSDGTLRSLAIMAALLAEESGSLVVIEEVDNGLHPSKARGILSLLAELSVKRGIRLLVTTHNPALLNAMTGKEASGIMVCYRDKANGDTKFQSLVNLDAFLRMASNERIGDAMESGEITRAVQGLEPEVDKNAVEWLRSL